jgi:hypothetical protein
MSKETKLAYTALAILVAYTLIVFYIVPPSDGKWINARGIAVEVTK